MKPNVRRQKEMFVSTMTELLWKVKTFSIKKNAFNYLPLELTLSLPWVYIWQLGDEKYAVLATQGPTLCFDPPSNFVRDEITEKVTPFLESKIIYSSTFSYICTDARVKRSWEIQSGGSFHMYIIKLCFLFLATNSSFQLTEEGKAGIACVLYSIILSRGFYE